MSRHPTALSDYEREFADSIPGLVAIFAPDGELEFVNRRFLDYLGLTLDELRSTSGDNPLHPEDRATLTSVFREAIRTGQPFEGEGRIRRADGVYRWHESRGAPLRSADGRVVRWHNLLIDVDERKRTAEELAASERRLKLTLEAMPALAWSTDPSGQADYFNERYLEYIGYTAEEASGWGWTTAVHPDDLNSVADTWQRCLVSEVAGEAEARVRRHDGEYRWHLFRANPLRNDLGAVVKWYGVNTDIEDRKRSEAALRRAYDSVAHAQRLSRTGSFSTDIVADDHHWSDELYRLMGIEPGTKVTLERVREVIHPDDLPMFDETVGRSKLGTDVRFAYRIVTADGDVKHMRGISIVVEQVEGRPLVVGALQDVTETVVAEEALNRARTELSHVARLATLSTLTASIAHEINQPLSGIITNSATCVRMLDADPPDLDGAREAVRRTIRDGNRAAAVTTRLRELFSKKEFSLDALDLNDATSEVITLSLGELQRNRVVVHAELADDLPPVIGDRIQLQQVLLNLLRNAAEAMADVEDRPRIMRIRSERESGDRVRVTVTDSGVGVDPQHADKIFDAFFTTKGSGMGIGLSVSQSIIERHQGRLWVEPNDGPGATFAFSIPSVGGVGDTNTSV